MEDLNLYDEDECVRDLFKSVITFCRDIKLNLGRKHVVNRGKFFKIEEIHSFTWVGYNYRTWKKIKCLRKTIVSDYYLNQS